MADRVSKVSYCHLEVPSRSGQGAQVLGALAQAGVDLQAFTGFPKGPGRAQVDLVTPDLALVRRVAARHGWRVSKTKRAFLVQGDDRVGAVHRHVQKLADRQDQRDCGRRAQCRQGALGDDPVGQAAGLRARGEGARRPLNDGRSRSPAERCAPCAGAEGHAAFPSTSPSSRSRSRARV